jgi:hypothetical protein
MMYVLPDQQVDAPLGPLAGVYEMVPFHYAPRGSQQQREGEIGGGIREYIRRVRHHNAVAGGSRHVDVVIAHRHVGDHLDPIQARQDFRRELVHELAHHGLFAANPARQILRAHTVVRLGVVQLGVFFQKGNGLGKYAFGHQYGRFHRRQIVAHAAPGLQFSHG